MTDTNGGNKIRSDSKNRHNKPVIPNTTAAAETTPNNHCQQKSRMNKKQKTYEWYHHQSECQTIRKECKYEYCPGRKRKHYRKGVLRGARPHETAYTCIECSILKQRPMHYCNDIKRGEKTVTRCHQLYHEKYFCNKVTTDNINTP